MHVLALTQPPGANTRPWCVFRRPGGAAERAGGGARGGGGRQRRRPRQRHHLAWLLHRPARNHGWGCGGGAGWRALCRGLLPRLPRPCQRLRPHLQRVHLLQPNGRVQVRGGGAACMGGVPGGGGGGCCCEAADPACFASSAAPYPAFSVPRPPTARRQLHRKGPRAVAHSGSLAVRAALAVADARGLASHPGGQGNCLPPTRARAARDQTPACGICVPSPPPSPPPTPASTQQSLLPPPRATLLQGPDVPFYGGAPIAVWGPEQEGYTRYLGFGLFTYGTLGGTDGRT